jgi:hypothetical protein
LLVFSNAVPGRDAAFKIWYEKCHAPEVLAKLPGFVSAQRFELHPVQRTGVGCGRPSEWGYLTMYELETDDLSASHLATEELVAAGGFTSHEGTLATGHAAWTYTPVGPRIELGDVPPSAAPALGSATHVFLALTSPAAGREAEFDRWYEIHIPEVVEHFPGLVSGQLFVRGDTQRVGMTPPWRCLAVYDLHADDMAEYHRLDAEVRASGKLTQHDGALDPDYGVWVYSELGPRIFATASRASASG